MGHGGGTTTATIQAFVNGALRAVWMQTYSVSDPSGVCSPAAMDILGDFVF